jgi:hypothetical protein
MQDLITIQHDESVLLAITPDGNVVLPTAERERSIAYAILCDAFALLCGVKLPHSIASMEADSGRSEQQSQQGPDARKSNGMTPPSEPQDTGNVVTLRQSPAPPLADC